MLQTCVFGDRRTQISEIVDVANLCSGDRGCCKLVISEISEIGDVAKYDFVDVANL